MKYDSKQPTKVKTPSARKAIMEKVKKASPEKVKVVVKRARSYGKGAK